MARSPARRQLIRFPLLLTVAFGAHLPSTRLAAFAADHRRRHEERLREYESGYARTEAAGDGFALATLRFGIRYEKAVLE